MWKGVLVSRFLFVLGSALALGCASTPKPAPATDTAPARPVTAQAQQPESGEAPAHSKHRFLPPAEIMKRIQDSSVLYRIDGKDSPPGGWADQLWPTKVAPVAHPRVVTEHGHPVVQEWPVNEKAEALLQEAEPLFQAEHYAEAAKLYERATTVCPDCYEAWSFRGDAALFSGDAATGLAHYRKAASLNPYDYRLFFYQGNALLHLGRLDEAREAWAWSLVLNPRNPLIRQVFQQNPQLGLVIREDAFVPRGVARKEGDAVAVEFDPDYGAEWLAYANCKGLWLGEPSHRQEVTGSTDPGFTSDEELECLASALAVHVSQREKGTADKVDPSLDGVVAIVQDGMASELIAFEMGARVYPQVTLTLGDAARQRLREYVLRYVLVPAGGR